MSKLRIVLEVTINLQSPLWILTKNFTHVLNPFLSLWKEIILNLYSLVFYSFVCLFNIYFPELIKCKNCADATFIGTHKVIWDWILWDLTDCSWAKLCCGEKVSRFQWLNSTHFHFSLCYSLTSLPSWNSQLHMSERIWRCSTQL